MGCNAGGDCASPGGSFCHASKVGRFLLKKGRLYGGIFGEKEFRVDRQGRVLISGKTL